MSAAEWAIVTIAWMFGFLPGWWLGQSWEREAARIDRMIDSIDGDDDVIGLYIDRGRIRPDDDGAW